jgi:hypothetical protein
MIPAVFGGVGLLFGLLLGFFLGGLSGESSERERAEAERATLVAENDTRLKEAEGARAKEEAARVEAERVAGELRLKVEVGRALELSQEALCDSRASNFGYAGRSLQLAREKLSAAAAAAPAGAAKAQLLALDQSFEPVLVQVLKFEASTEQAIQGLITQLQAARDTIAAGK